MKSLTSSVLLLISILSGLTINAQVKITDGADLIPDQNSILELESATKGFLPPRLAITDLGLATPLTSPVPAGMIVYSSGGAVADGFYYWNGAKWVSFTVSETLFSKSASATLLKSETFVLASGDITLTLPAITAADNGLSITIKNVGTHLDLVTVTGNSGATIDGIGSGSLMRWNSGIYVATGGNWVTKGPPVMRNKIMVSANSSFATIREAFEFLAVHMTTPTVIVLESEMNLITETIVIDLPLAVTVEANSYGSAVIGPGPGMIAKPLFDCLSESYFKMLVFDGSTLAGYGTSPGEDAISLTGDASYHEIKDCSFEGFYNGVSLLSNAELWLFECDFINCSENGLIIDSSSPGATVKVSETDFTDNKRGVNLFAGSGTTATLNSGFYSNSDPGDVAILYNPGSFSFENLIITGNSWNSIGTGISGFDFTRADGRDADAFIENNAGVEDEKPHGKVNVVNNTLTTNCVSANAWYKANWVNSSSLTTSLTIGDNRITYQPVRPRDLVFIISGDLTVDASNRVITIGIVRNGVSSVRYGETALRITNANQPFQFSTVIYIEDVEEGDFFELFCSSASGSDLLIFQDVNWFVTSQ